MTCWISVDVLSEEPRASGTGVERAGRDRVRESCRHYAGWESVWSARLLLLCPPSFALHHCQTDKKTGWQADGQRISVCLCVWDAWTDLPAKGWIWLNTESKKHLIITLKTLLNIQFVCVWVSVPCVGLTQIQSRLSALYACVYLCGIFVRFCARVVSEQDQDKLYSEEQIGFLCWVGTASRGVWVFVLMSLLSNGEILGCGSTDWRESEVWRPTFLQKPSTAIFHCFFIRFSNIIWNVFQYDIQKCCTLMTPSGSRG